MLFRDLPGGDWLAITQPAHALVSGQMLRAWGAAGFARPDPLEEVTTAAAQHDVAWMGWETAPTLDPGTGRPHLFRRVGARQHAPMWAAGVELALQAWGPWVALLLSRHGSLIYTRYGDRHRMAPEDAAAADHYLETQGAMQRGWAAALRAPAAQVERNGALVAVVDALSLAVCGELPVPGQAGEAPLEAGGTAALRVDERGDGAFVVDPWPFAVPAVVLTYPARRFKAADRWAEEGAMRAALAAAPWEMVSARLVPAA